MGWRPELGGNNAESTASLNTPMSSRGWNEQSMSKGGSHPGDKGGMKETVALGAPPSTATSEPVGMQITEELGGTQPQKGTFPTGTSIRTA